MWHHLRARIENIQLRVLHPNIQEHQTVDILRGLPEGSRLSPTLFGIFVADLIHELQTQFPHDVINLAPGLQHNGTTKIWIQPGGLLYIDDVHLPARTASHVTCLPDMECLKSSADQHTEDKSHGFLRDPLPPQGTQWPALIQPNPAPLPHPRALPNLFPLLLSHYRGTPI